MLKNIRQLRKQVDLNPKQNKIRYRWNVYEEN